MRILDSLGFGKDQLRPWTPKKVSSKKSMLPAETGYPKGCFGNRQYKLRHERPRRLRMGKPQNWKQARDAGLTWPYHPKAKRGGGHGRKKTVV